LVGKETRKVIYLDCDLLVTDSLRPLWQTDMTDFALAGVPFPQDEHKKTLGIPGHKGYINSGVLLLNLDVWRDQNLTPRLIDYIGKNAPILKYHDQDALNAVLFDQIGFLDRRWNVTNRIFQESAEQLRLAPEVHRDLKAAPGIVHFTADYKPWHYFNPNPYKPLYWKLLKATPYRNYRPPLRSALKFLPVRYRPQTLYAKLFKKAA
jgi:lipopolysaccharide biosynthesis glycosyltransferase